MREIISGQVWIGNARDVRNIQKLFACGIEAVVDLALDEPAFQSPREIVYCRFPLLDGEGNSAHLLRSAIHAVANLIDQGIPVLVGCSGGMSRSPAIVAAAFAYSKRQSAIDWLNQIAATGPHDVSPALWNDICACNKASETVPTRNPQLKLIVIRSMDCEKAVKFFTTLGMTFQNEQHGNGPVHLSAEFDGGVFEIYPAKTIEDVDRTTRLGFSVIDPVDVIGEMKSLGYPIINELKETDWGMRGVVRDPDGRSVEVHARTTPQHADNSR